MLRGFKPLIIMIIRRKGKMSCAGYSHIHYHAGTRVSLVEIKEHACSKCHLGLLYENNASNVNFNFYFFLFCRFSLSGVAVESYKTEVTSRLTLTLHDPDGRVDGDDVAYTYADAVTWASGPATQWWQHCRVNRNNMYLMIRTYR